MYCRKCGKELEDKWKVCPYCGEAVNAGEPTEETSGAIKTVKFYQKWPFWVAVVLVCIIAAFLLSNIIGQGKNAADDKVTKENTVETEEKNAKPVTDFSEQDFSSLLGKSESDIEEMGLVQNGDTGEYSALEGNLLVKVTDGQIQEIIIKGDEKTAPAFGTVKLGSSGDEAKTQLAGEYPESQEITDGFKLLNLDSKGSVECALTDNKISQIRFVRLSDEEIAAFKTAKEEKLRAEYIFPDSDKKYLSEDEIRTKTVDQMFTGRNEIFARHGYIFSDENLKNHFESTSWYAGTVPAEQFNSDQVFNEFEKKNVELIQQIEDEINGITENNSQPDVFIGMSGSYHCGTADDSGVIDVYVEGDYINIAIGTHSFPGIIGGVGGGLEGTIQDNQTATFNYLDCVFTLTWSDIGVFTVTRSGSTGLAEVDACTDYATYVNEEY